MTREQAINYLFSCGFTNEQVGEVVRALTYDPTTKNNLGVDCISRKAAEDITWQDPSYTDPLNILTEVRDKIRELPSVTPQLSAPEVTALAEWTEKLTKASEDAYNKGYADGMKAQEPRKGEWLRMSDLSEQEDDRYKCSRCGNVVHYTNKMDLYTFNSWCGRCGSDNGRHIN